MDRTERFYKIDQMLNDRSIVPVRDFLEELSISPATFKRDLEYMRDRFHAPVVWDREIRGYRFDAPLPDAPRFELPGLWFNADEIRALLTMQQLLSNLQPGLLEPHVQPLLARLRSLLDVGEHAADEVERRVRILHVGARGMKLPHFQLVASAVLKRARIWIRYRGRSRDDETEREISPQRLVYYRENWYADAWCHLRDDLRSFAVDAVLDAAPVDKKAKTVAERDLDEVLASGYGIFSGRKTVWAKLRFSPLAARWVASQAWHSKQKSATLADGSYVLEIPYADDRELLMDILKFGPDVEVLEPDALRQRVKDQLAAAARLYR